jgi:DNA-binding CsgD family transcriptional regulator
VRFGRRRAEEGASLRLRVLYLEVGQLRKEFVKRWLSPAEWEIVCLACERLDNLTIARRLRKSPRTVAHQFTAVYEKLAEWLGFPPGKPRRNVLIAEFSPYFALREGSPKEPRKRFPTSMGRSSDATGTPCG